jgi:hypothetical protein
MLRDWYAFNSEVIDKFLATMYKRCRCVCISNIWINTYVSISFVELTRNDFTQLGRDNARMRVFFARDVDTKYIGIPDADIVRFLEMELYSI